MSRLGLLDRLIDGPAKAEASGRELKGEDWALMRGGQSSRRKAISPAEASVKVGLSALATTRRPLPLSHPLSRALGASVLTFGMPDLAQIPGGATERQRRLAVVIAAAASLFDPRLVGVRVDVVARGGGQPGPPSLSVSATLAVPPVPRALEWRARLIEGRLWPETSNG